MNVLRAYTYPGLSKAEFIAELQSHVEADRLVQGTYFEGNGNWRGCAVGCSLESVRQRLGLRTIEHGKHAEYETYLRIPSVLACLEDRIFESLPPDKARDWPLRFSRAIPEGADLSGVWNRFAPWLLREIALPTVVRDEWGVRPAIQRVIAGYESGWTATRATAYAADTASAYAAYAADVAADTAASAYTAYAAYAADAAADTAYAAASAADAAASATRATAYADAAASATRATAYAADTAAYAAYATYATYYAARAAAYATYAADAIDAATRATAYAADTASAYAAYAADVAADTAYAAWRRIADKLCALVAAAPIPEDDR